MKTKKLNTPTYSTTSFYLSCFLLARGVQLVGLDQTDDLDRRSFVFVDSPSRQILADEYNFAEDAEVSVRDFISAIRKLKALLHEPK